MAGPLPLPYSLGHLSTDCNPAWAVIGAALRKPCGNSASTKSLIPGKEAVQIPEGIQQLLKELNFSCSVIFQAKF